MNFEFEADMHCLAKFFAMFFCTIALNTAMATQLKTNLQITIEKVEHEDQQMDMLCFIKTTLFNGKIIIFDCCAPCKINYIYGICCSPKFCYEDSAFSNQIIENFKIIQQNPIGKRLCEDIVDATPPKSPLIIFSCDFVKKIRNAYNKVCELQNIKPSLSNMPQMLYLTKEEENEVTANWGDPVPLNIQNIVVNDEKLMRLVPAEIKQYMPYSSEDGFAKTFNSYAATPGCSHFRFKDTVIQEYNMIMCSFESDSKVANIFGFKFSLVNTESVQLTNIPFIDDITLFHELNHYRHFLNLEKFPTRDATFSSKSNAFENNSSLIKLLNRKLVIDMYNAEEELQLTGFTETEDGEIYDEINETNYRVKKSPGQSCFIRFPYGAVDKGVLLDSDIVNMLLNIAQGEKSMK